MISFTSFCKDTIRLQLTDGQRVYSLVVFDKVDPEKLSPRDRETARVLFGNVDTIPRSARRTALGIFGRGSGKDEIGGAYALWRMLTADCSKVGVGDVGTLVIIAPDKKLAAIALRRTIARARSVPEISRLIERETSEGFELRRPDGVLVSLEVLAASHAGSSGRGRSILGVLLTEAAFFRSDEAAVADAEIYNALMPRLMSGGLILLFSTPWAETGLLWSLYEANHTHPVNAIVGQASSAFMRPDDADLAERVLIEEERDPVNAAREYGGQFVGVGSSGFFSAAAIDACVDESVTQITRRDRRQSQVIAWDLGFNLDSSALAAIAFDTRIATVAYIHEMTPHPGAPLSPTEVVRQFARVHTMLEHHSFKADQFNAASVRETAAQHGLKMFQIPTHLKVERHLAAKFLFDEKRVLLPKNPRLIQQLKDVVSKPLPGGGLKIYTPRRVGRAHGDIASAVIVGLAHAKESMATAPKRERFALYRAQMDDQFEQVTQTVHGGPRWLELAARMHARAKASIPEMYTQTRLGPSIWARLQWEEKQKIAAEIAAAMATTDTDEDTGT